MIVVCGKCGSKTIRGNNIEVVEGQGLSLPSLSCMTCGNTSESPKYGFKEDGVAKEYASAGICTNCKRERIIIQSMGVCSTCQRAARGTVGEERVKSLVDIKGKILSGEVTTRTGPKKQSEKQKTEEQLKIQIEKKSKTTQDIIVLHFKSEIDLQVKACIEKEAVYNRRTPDQQILWICQNSFKEKLCQFE